MNDESRRKFLAFFSGAGLGGTLLPGVLWAQLQQDATQKVTQPMLVDALALSEPVDWVGNAWGGHVGVALACAAPPRVRTLTTIAAPVRGFTLAEKLTKGWPLVWLYRLAGPRAILVASSSDLGS